MTTLIIPCAGRATLDGKPTCIARHPDGSYLFEKCISGINLTKIKRLIVTVLETDNSKYDIKSKICDIFSSYSNNVELCLLPSKTSGPAETIYLTIKNMKITGQIFIKDVDNFLSIRDVYHENFVVGLDVFDYDIRNLKTKSFITTNEQNYILDIIEKQIKSNIICAGFYGLKKAEDFLMAYEALNDSNYDIKKLYVSHIITYLIGYNNNIFQYVKVDDFESYDTQEDWDYIKKHFLKSQIKNKLALFDLDGTLFNTNEVNYLAYKEALKQYKFDFKREYWYQNCIGRHYKDFLSDIGIVDEEILQNIHKLKKQAYKKYLSKAQENLNLFRIIELIRTEYHIALVTTASRKNVEDILNEFDKLKIFDKIFTQEDVSKMKPDPEGYLKAMQYFNINPEDTIIFEDSEAGLEAAKSSGAYYYKVFKFND